MRKVSICSFALLFLLVGAALPARAATIDFETVPGDVPSEGLIINTQYQGLFGVSFSLEEGGSPVLAEVGTPRTAFAGPPDSTGDDNPVLVPDQNLGQFFLTDDGAPAGTPKTLIATYVNPVAQASGVIVDIDRRSDGTFERWLLQARDATDVAIDSIILTAEFDALTTTGDGIAKPWLFNHGSADIYSIRIFYTGDAVNVGLAFDNFSPSSLESIPEPATLLLLGSGLAGLAAFRVRRARRK